MNADQSLEKCVKSALEEGIVLRDDILHAIERAARGEVRRRWLRGKAFRLGVPMLLAASLALAVGMRVVLTGVEGASGGSVVENAIEILCELDGVGGRPMTASTEEERLLAWQDAPCVVSPEYL